MTLLVLGVDHRNAPASVRELLACEGDRRDALLGRLRREFPDSEFVLVSTCNRVELYAATADEGAAPGVGALIDALARFHDTHAEAFAAHLIDRRDEEMVAHLFKVSASLESLVLGEGQIIGQVRDAFLAARKAGAVGKILHRIFDQALHVGKKVREQTGMDQGKLSVASVAVDVARDVFDTFEDKTVLVIGAGKMGDLTLQHLATLKPGTILVTNRSLPRAEDAARRFGGRAVPFDRLGQALIEADVVVSTTAAEQPIVSYETYARVQRARRNRLALILDIAIPRDFEGKIGDLEQVLLYNVDDLRAQAEQNLAKRRKGIEPALAIIERETAACLAALRHNRHAGALLRKLGDSFDGVRRRELDSLYARCPDLTDSQREAIAHAMHRFQNQVLHQPRAALRSAAEEPTEHPHPLLNAVRHLFGLADV